jgi:hypothetical protein
MRKGPTIVKLAPSECLALLECRESGRPDAGAEEQRREAVLRAGQPVGPADRYIQRRYRWRRSAGVSGTAPVCARITRAGQSPTSSVDLSSPLRRAPIDHAETSTFVARAAEHIL